MDWTFEDAFGDDFGESPEDAKAYVSAQLALGHISPADAKKSIAMQDIMIAAQRRIPAPPPVQPETAAQRRAHDIKTATLLTETGAIYLGPAVVAVGAAKLLGVSWLGAATIGVLTGVITVPLVLAWAIRTQGI